MPIPVLLNSPRKSDYGPGSLHFLEKFVILRSMRCKAVMIVAFISLALCHASRISDQFSSWKETLVSSFDTFFDSSLEFSLAFLTAALVSSLDSLPSLALVSFSKPGNLTAISSSSSSAPSALRFFDRVAGVFFLAEAAFGFVTLPLGALTAGAAASASSILPSFLFSPSVALVASFLRKNS